MKRISSIVLLALAVMLTANAQQRKATPAAKSSPAAKAISATFAIVNMGESSLEKPLAEGPDCLYLIDQLDRSVISIDKKTGTIKRYIPGGRDKMITAIGHDGRLRQGAHHPPAGLHGHRVLTQQAVARGLRFGCHPVRHGRWAVQARA